MGIASPAGLDNLTGRPRQPKEMSAPATNNPPSTLRYRQRPVEKIRLRMADLASAVPTEHLLRELPGEDFIEIDARASLAHIVPKISLRELAEERPDLFLPVDEFVKLPAHRIATAYRLSEESYEPAEEFAPREQTRSRTFRGLHDRRSKSRPSLPQQSPPLHRTGSRRRTIPCPACTR
jgi:hypothetical protein